MHQAFVKDCITSIYVSSHKDMVGRTKVSALGEDGLHLHRCPGVREGDRLSLALTLPGRAFPVKIQGFVLRLDHYGDGAWIQFARQDVSDYHRYNGFLVQLYRKQVA